jgi:hypothetical protein
MKANELRIGNWVHDKIGRSCQILEIRGDHYCTKLLNGSKLKYHYHTSSPIPLTEEWLVKLGFECFCKNTDYEMFCIGYEEDDSHEGIGSYDCDFELNKNDDGSWHFELSSVDIKYVHQLQNLYFAITGKEL